MKRKTKLQHPDPRKWAGNPRDGEGRGRGVEYIAPLVGQTDPAVSGARSWGSHAKIRCGTGMSGLAVPEQMGGEVGSGGWEGKGQRCVG
jgi:hypothetical protein